MGNLMDSMSLKPKEEERARVWRLGGSAHCGSAVSRLSRRPRLHGLRSPGANIPRKRAFLSMVSPLPRLPWRLSSPSCSRQRSPRCVAPRGGWRHSLSSARLSCPATPPREPPCMGPLGCRCGWHTCSGARTRHGIALSRPLSRCSPSTTAHQIACKNEMRSSISLQVYRAQLSCGRH